MHFLLIAYLLLNITFVSQLLRRSDVCSRTAMVAASSVTTVMMITAMLLRPVQGDSWRYYQTFLALRGMDLIEVLALPEVDLLYVGLNWLVGQLGSAPLLLFGTTLVIYFTVLLVALRRYLGHLHTAVLIMCYAAYPFFVTYGANGLRQGLAQVFLLMAYVQFRCRKHTAWVWLLLAPFWHSGAWLAVGVTLAHMTMCRMVRVERHRWWLVLGTLAFVIGLSATGLNESIMSSMIANFELRQTHVGYFGGVDEVESVGYKTGFRLDFLLFSLIPLAIALWQRRRAPILSYDRSGWWLSLYLSLNIIYHLFSFAPFADRFSGFSWFIMPLVVFLQARDVGRRNAISAFALITFFTNALAFNFYTISGIAVINI